jgi:hypothetical protein
MDNGRRKAAASSIETPVTPPSMKWLDSRKAFRPKAAEITPATMNKAFFNSELGRFIWAASGGAGFSGGVSAAEDVGFIGASRLGTRVEI